MKTSLREEILDLLEKDKSFRYAVAGYLGVLEILEKLDKLIEEQIKLRKETNKIWIEFQELKKETSEIRQEVLEIRKENQKIWKEIEEIRRENHRIWLELRGIKRENQKIWSEIEGIKKENQKIWLEIKRIEENIESLREDTNRIFRVIDARLTRVEHTLEKLTLDIEEEAREVLRYRLKQMGIKVDLRRLELPGLEIDLYGASEETCVIGEVSVRAGLGVLHRLLRKYEKIKSSYPELLRRRVILVIYTSLALSELVEEAAEKKVWVLKATGDIVEPTWLENSFDRAS